jgi:Ni/Fe-hydrogenase subunit HybB-like protein
MNWSYFPNISEILITVGLVAAEITGYILLIKNFPILAGAPRAAEA